jgi:hypothetical protein
LLLLALLLLRKLRPQGLVKPALIFGLASFTAYLSYPYTLLAALA